jgi:hypothetical protein
MRHENYWWGDRDVELHIVFLYETLDYRYGNAIRQYRQEPV